MHCLEVLIALNNGQKEIKREIKVNLPKINEEKKNKQGEK